MKSRFVHRLRYIEDMNISEDIWKKWSLEMQQEKNSSESDNRRSSMWETDKWLQKE